MLKTLAVIGIVIVVAIAALLIYAAMKPDDFQVQRSAVIKAPAQKIFPMIEDFRKWGAWSPYEKMDPSMTRTYSGADKGKGAVYAWSSNGKAGQGRMEIKDAPAPQKVLIDLEFTKPMEAKNIAEFALAPEADGTRVTWTMRGRMPFIGKVMSTFFNMDQMVGKDFETGLASMKAAAEAP